MEILRFIIYLPSSRRRQISFAIIHLYFLSIENGDVELFHVCHHISRSLRMEVFELILSNFSDLFSVYLNLSLHYISFSIYSFVRLNLHMKHRIYFVISL